jgi:hypothetical protein
MTFLWVGTCGKHGQYDLQRLVENKAFKESQWVILVGSNGSECCYTFIFNSFCLWNQTIRRGGWRHWSKRFHAWNHGTMFKCPCSIAIVIIIDIFIIVLQVSTMYLEEDSRVAHFH